MPEHTVKAGECLSSIAASYGFRDYRTICDHPSNAAFRAKRPNPNLIYPGDVVMIPVAAPGGRPVTARRPERCSRKSMGIDGVRHKEPSP